MTARQLFLKTMAERRCYPKGSLDWEYRTRAARKYVWLMRGVPTTEWRAQ